ncbi:MAG: hypothetical protein JKY60_14290 [Kordiimonadaceae bacterium]|nr:hypothetical protein [Kordiimonadaceae bacterium]
MSLLNLVPVRALMQRGIFILAVSAALLISHAAGATEAEEIQIKPIRFGVTDFIPRAYTENGVLKGSTLLRARELAAEAGLTTVELLMPISRLYHEAKLGEGTLDAWVSIDIPSLTKLGVLVKPSVFEPLRLHLFSLNSSVPSSIDDLEVDAVITLLGFRFSGWVDRLKSKRPDMQVLTVPNHISAWRTLKAQRAPYFLAYKSPSLFYAEQLGLTDFRSIELAVTPLYFFISRNNPNAELIAKRYSEAAKRILAREVLEK